MQVPGLQDPKALKDLIGKTARLEFRMVDPNADPAEVAAGRVPVGSEIVPYAPGAGNGVPYEVLRRQVMISGEQLINAQQGYDQQGGLPVVNIRFDLGRVQHFCTCNFAKRRQALCHGARRSGFVGTLDQRADTWRASADFREFHCGECQCPVNFAAVGRVAGQDGGGRGTTVSPELGADSIRKGAIAGIIATVAVLSFMIVVYGRFGLYANIALVFNVSMIIAIMAAFNATLTLPGIAGFVLTIGAAVDANVLINERIREELKRGRKVISHRHRL